MNLAKTQERSLGIDLGGSNLRWVVSDNQWFGEITKCEAPRTYDDCLRLIGDIIQVATENSKITSAGIGLPGRTDPEKPIWIPNLTYLNQSNLGAELERKTGIPITFINDAQAALIGEAEFGAAKGCRNAILVTIGTGIGGAIMINGQIYVGHHGTAGSFGWLMAPVRLHPNPEHGPWERWASGSTLSLIAREMGLKPKEFLSKKTLDSDGVIKEALIDYSIRIGKGLGSLASLLDPQVVIVSGGIVDSWEILSNAIHQGFNQTASPSVRNCPLKVSGLGSQSGAVGAATTARKYFANTRKQTKESTNG